MTQSMIDSMDLSFRVVVPGTLISVKVAAGTGLAAAAVPASDGPEISAAVRAAGTRNRAALRTLLRDSLTTNLDI